MCRKHTSDASNNNQNAGAKNEATLPDLWVQKYGHNFVHVAGWATLANFDKHIDTYLWAGIGIGTCFPMPTSPRAKVQTQGQ